MQLYDVCIKLMRKHEVLRNSDKQLMWSVWKELGFSDGVTLHRDSFFDDDCPTPESITRCRRKIQEQHPNLQATEDVQKERQKKAQMKGKHTFKEEVQSIKQGHFEVRNGVEVWVVD